ncbi:MAG: hypothetical protein A2X32_05535 [Elusimicrobia bacterium GWC2_64_44]|nr:MAG: hypothetical protein A2X32_05535 [Elusimicrobia bacterium GWC2_64_44]
MNLSAPFAAAQGLGPVSADPLELHSPALLQQLAYIPDYAVESDTAPVTEEEVVDLEEGEDSEEYMYISSGLAHAPQPVNLGGNGSLTLTRSDTGEKITAHYRRSDGTYDGQELKMLDRAMRCALTGHEVQMSVKLIELLDAVEDKFGKKGLTLLSGYRTPRNNHRIRGAARESLHMLGWAADIRIPGYSSTKVKTYARKLSAGGIGYYPYKGFTHLDVGKSRYWVMRRPVRRRARRKAPRQPSHRAAARPASKSTAARRPAKSVTAAKPARKKTAFMRASPF